MLFRKKRRISSDITEFIGNEEEKNFPASLDEGNLIQTEQNEGLSVRFEQIYSLTSDEEKRLIEVKDKQLLDRIDNTIPGCGQVAANAIAFNNYNQMIQRGGRLYQAVIPNGAKLTGSKEVAGAVRGFYRGADGIKGQANFLPVNGNIGKGMAAMNIVNATMGVAAMVVGQYYMNQINSKLDSISDDLKHISGFQNNEYKSKVLALITQIQKCSTFEMEIMENDELRQRELNKLSDLEHKCAELLGQANLGIMDLVGKTEKSFEDYEHAVAQTNMWYQCQQVLLEVMARIAELIYALNLGAVTKDYCIAMYDTYVKQAEDTLNSLNVWHLFNGKKWKIDIHSGRRKRQGFDDFIMLVPGLFDPNLHYRTISSRIAGMIKEQTDRSVTNNEVHRSDLFREDVRLVSKDGKMYYLPPAEIVS